MTTRDRVVNSQGGFTLVELLVVVAVAGLIAGLAVSSFRNVNASWRRLSDKSENAEKKAGLRLFLQALLSGCYPSVSLGREGKAVLAFQGTTTEMYFLGPLPARFDTDDIVEYRLRFTLAHSMILSWRFDRPYTDNPGMGSWSDITIATGLSMPSFFYYGSADKDDRPIWQTSWSRPDALPQLIDVRLSPQQGDDDLIVAPAISTVFCDNASRSQCPT